MREVTGGRVADVARFESFVVIAVARGEAPTHHETPVRARTAVVRQPREGRSRVSFLANSLERNGEVAELDCSGFEPGGVNGNGRGVLSGSWHEIPPQPTCDGADDSSPPLAVT